MKDVSRAGYRPFLKPWTVVERGESFIVMDAGERTLAHVYFEDDHTRRDFMKRLSKYDARRMADQILRLPELIAFKREARNRE